MRRTRILFLFLAALSFPEADAQFPRFRFQHLSVEDGLSQDIVTAIAQDDLGFMWFGTEDGLNVFDGFSFTIFKHTPGDSSTLAGNDITSLCADGRGHLWVGTPAGADVIDIRTRVIRHVYATGGERPGGVAALAAAGSGDLWIATNRGLFKTAGLTARRVRIPGKPDTVRFWSLNAEGTERLWCEGAGGVDCYRVSGDSLVSLDIPQSFRRELSGHAVSSVLRDSKRSVWVCTADDGIYQFDSTLHPLNHFSARPGGAGALRDNGVRTVVEDRSGLLWFGTMSGAEVLDPGTGEFTHVVEEASRPGGLIGSRGYSLCLDRSGILWLGTYRGGINTYAPFREKFRLYSLAEGALPRNPYAILVTSDGTLLVGTERGVYSPVTGRGTAGWIRRRGYEGHVISSLNQTRSGEVWVGMEGSIGTLPGWSTHPRIIRLPVNDPVHFVYEDARGTLWIGTDVRGLFLAGRDGSPPVQWMPRGEKIDGGAWTIAEDQRGSLWIGTWISPWLYEYDRSIDSVFRFGSGPGSDREFTGTSVKAIREDSAGNLWFGTWGTGLYRRDHATGAFTRFTEADGLSSNFVKSVEIDRHGGLWVGTERGLSWLDPLRGSFRNFSQRDGLQGNFFYSGASFRDSNGVMYFGGPGGIIVFDPDSIRYNMSAPPVVITGFNVFEKPVPFVALPGGSGSVVLKHDQVFFSFEFVALDFTDPPRNRYAYMLEGFDRSWVDASGRRYASYTHLDPGTYTFRVRASNNDGAWNDRGASMTVVITPAFWSTWWFRVAVVALLLLASFAFYRSRIRSLLEVERMRQRIARDLHDDIGTNLSAIVIASEMAGGAETGGAGSPSHTAAFEDIRTVALLTQEHMRDIVWMLNPANDSVGLLVERMRDDASRLLRATPHTFHAPQKESSGRVELGVKRNIFLIYKEALHNIVKHSRATAVSIEVVFSNSRIEFAVRDNGRGFDPGTVVRGNGIDSMTERARALGADFSIGSSPGRGTEIRLVTKIA